MRKETILIQKLFSMILAAIALLFLVSSAQAASDNEWEIIIAPYFFAGAADYDATIDGRTVGVDLSFKDILDNFDVLGGSLRFEAWKGDWGVILDGKFTDLDGDFGPNDNLNANLRDFMVDLLGAYRIKKSTLLDRPLLINVSGGLRYHYLKQKASLSLPRELPKIRVGDSQDWIEPVVGSSIRWAFAEKLALVTRGDVGGFGIGSASRLTWNVTTYLNYQFSRHWSVAGGYHYFDMDYSKGSGKDKFGYDGNVSGIIMGVVWRN